MRLSCLQIVAFLPGLACRHSAHAVAVLTGSGTPPRSCVGASCAHKQSWTRACLPVRSMAAAVASDAPRDCISSIWGSSCWSVHTSSREAHTGSALSPAHTCRGHAQVKREHICSSGVVQPTVSELLNCAGMHMLTAECCTWLACPPSQPAVGSPLRMASWVHCAPSCFPSLGALCLRQHVTRLLEVS